MAPRRGRPARERSSAPTIASSENDSFVCGTEVRTRHRRRIPRARFTKTLGSSETREIMQVVDRSMTQADVVSAAYDAVFTGLESSPTLQCIWREHALGDDYP